MISRRQKAIIWLVLLAAMAGSTIGCNLFKSDTTKPTLPDLPLQKEKAITQVITSKTGGWIFYNDAVRELGVYFPPGSLAKDTEIVLTPIERLSVGVSDVIDAGFVVEEKGTGKSPTLKKPVALAFKMPDSDPKVTIYRYLAEDGAYTPITSRLITSQGSNILMTGVTSFSAYGVKKPSADDAKAFESEQESIYKGSLAVSADGAAPLEISTDAGKITVTSKMTMSLLCPEAVIRGGVYKGDCSATVYVSGVNTQSYVLAGSASMDYLLPSKSTDRPKTLPSNLKGKVESRAEAKGYLEFGPDAAALAALVNAPGTNVPVDFRPSQDGLSWPFKVFMVPGTDEALVVTAFGFYMGKFESARAVH